MAKVLILSFVGVCQTWVPVTRATQGTRATDATWGHTCNLGPHMQPGGTHAPWATLATYGHTCYLHYTCNLGPHELPGPNMPPAATHAT